MGRIPFLYYTISAKMYQLAERHIFA